MPSAEPRRPRTRAETKAATRQALLEAGLQEFIERGQDRPSLDEICARAGFTRGAFYVHFRDREDFFVAVMEWALGQILDSILGPDGGDDNLDETVRRFADFVASGVWPAVGRQRLPVHRLMEAVGRSEVVRKHFAQLFELTVERLARSARRSQQAGDTRGDIDPAHTARLLAVSAFGSLLLHEAGIEIDPALQRDATLSLLRPARLD